MLLALGGGVGLPLGIPPAEEDPLIANIAPEKCLYYTSWAGMATPDPESENRTERLLAEPEMQQSIREIERRITESLQKLATEHGPPEAAVTVAHVPKLLKTLATRPTAIYVADAKLGPDGVHVDAGMLMNVGAEAPQVLASLETLQKTYLGDAVKAVQLGKATLYRIEAGGPVPPIMWCVRGAYVLVGIGDDAIENMSARARTEPPEWFTTISTQLPVERRATLTYIDVKALAERFAPMGGPQARTIIDALGLGNVTSLTAVTGLDKEGFVSRSLLGIDGQPTGIFAVAAGEPLTAEDLAPIPRDATIAAAARLNADKLLGLFLSTVEKIEPRARGEILEGIGEMNRELGIDLRADVLQSLGDVWCVYNSPGEGGLVVTGLTATVQVRDRDRLATAHEKILAAYRAATTGPDGTRSRYTPQVRQFEFAGKEVFFLTNLDDDFPLTPSWCLTERELIVALFPQNIKAYLSRGDDYQSLAEAPPVAELLASDAGPTMLAYQNTRELFELFYPIVQIAAHMASYELTREGLDIDISLLPSANAMGPHLRPGVTAVRQTGAGIEVLSRQTLPGGNIGATAPIAVGVAVPAVLEARKAARRVQSMNNLKQIAVATLNYESVTNTFPAAYNTDKDGKPLLSWRVHILPYIEENDLYDRFHLDEPWDSEHNKKLIATMPTTYRAPSSKAEPGMTNYVAVRGKNTVIAAPATAEDGSRKRPTGTHVAQIRDGTSNTAMVVEASDQKAVIWTKPDDYEYDPDNPAKDLAGLRAGGLFLAVFADGHVQIIPSQISAKTLNAIFTRSGGEEVDMGELYSRPRRTRFDIPEPKPPREDVAPEEPDPFR